MRGQKKTKMGRVVGIKNDKTAVVQVERLNLDQVFHKYVRRLDKYQAHDEKNECQIGDRVEIVEVKPISKSKNWRISRFIHKASDDLIDIKA